LHDKVPAKEIAVISREHKQLITLLPYLDTLSVPYTYTRKENVFDERHVQELIILCRLLSTVGSSTFERDDLLPEILAFPFWGLSRLSIWEIAEHAKRNNISWLEAMRTSDVQEIQSISHFLIEVGVASQTTPLEIILDTLIGSKDLPKVSDSPDEDEVYTPSVLTLTTTFTSPYKSYYFGEHALSQNASAYINFLSSLRVFIHALRNYKEGESLRTHDVGDFVDMHSAYNIPLINETPFAHNENSVQLLTSHGAKGLEFAYVFIISLNDAIWAGGKRGSKLSFPSNLPLANAGDDEDDFIRLFYVALTRARHTLYLTHHKSPLRFLAAPTMPERETTSPVVTAGDVLVHGLSVYHTEPFASDEKALLEKVVEGYMLSPTHLNNFLNVIDGGPLSFLEQNLLRFPQAMTASSVYGSAIHKTLEEAHILAKQEKKTPPLTQLLDTFVREMKRGRLQESDEKKFTARGRLALTEYYKHKAGSIRGNAIVELNFAKQSVMIDGALFTGKIDQIVEDEDKNWIVIDLKTGKGFSAWDEKGMTVYDEIKLHHYRTQLMMYKILVEHSRDYSTHTVTQGVLEFVEEVEGEKVQELLLSFENNSLRDEVARIKDLATIVYKKIVTLDFPDITEYPKTLEGIKEFEEDLLSGKK
jgi:DNA helicase II / ATP-dependent DNA helicase PcrA